MKQLLLIAALFSSIAAGAQTASDKDPGASGYYEKYMQAHPEVKRQDSIDAAKLAAENDAEEKRLIKKYGKAAYQKANDGNVWLGMPYELCEVAKGAPALDKRSYTQSGIVTTMYYAHESGSIVVKNHKVIAINE
jgi:hypothetical protein